MENNETLKILGAGGFGTVYLLPNNNVIKAIKDHTNCMAAEEEMKKQRDIYASFVELQNLKADEELINLVKKYVVLSDPLNAKNEPITINDHIYSCYFEMTRLVGIPLNIYEQFDMNIDNSFDKEYLAQHKSDFFILLQLTYNTDLPNKIYGTNYSRAKISDKNPLRGYFISENDVSILNFLRNYYNLLLSDNQIQQIIGFIYGWIFFKAKYVPIDIEIALGYDSLTKEFKINVLDFGMTFFYNVNNVDEIKHDFKYDQILKALNTYISETPLEKRNVDGIIENIQNKVLDNIDYDLYASTESKNTLQGWYLAKKYSGLKLNNNNIKGGSSYYKKYQKYKHKFESLRSFRNFFGSINY